MSAEQHDAGGKSRLAMIDGVDGKAGFSPCGRYRLWLSRDWSWRRHSDGRSQYALWIGMNPSVAEADVDDPTIRREMAFTKAMGIDTYVKCNVMELPGNQSKSAALCHPAFRQEHRVHRRHGERGAVRDGDCGLGRAAETAPPICR